MPEQSVRKKRVQRGKFQLRWNERPPLEIAPLEAGIPRESCDARTEEAGSRSGGTRLNSFLWKETDGTGERNGVPGQKCFRPIPARKTGSSSTRFEGREVNRRGEIEIDKSAQGDEGLKRDEFGFEREKISKRRVQKARAGRAPNGFRNEEIYRVASRVVPRLRR